MKESPGKGPASHPDPESCVDGRKAGSEALTGAHAGQPSSCEIRQSGVPTPLSEAEGHTGTVRSWLRALRRRSQRSRLSWAVFGPLTDRCIPRPQILHPHPNDRFYAKHPK